MTGSEIQRGPRWAAMAMAAATMIVALAGGQAQAGIVYQAINENVYTDRFTPGQYDLTAGGQVIGTFKGTYYSDIFMSSAGLNFAPASTTSYVGLSGTPQALAAGDLISSASSFSQDLAVMASYTVSLFTGVSSSGNFYNVTDAYLGLSFELNGATRYGWVQLSNEIDSYGNSDSLTITAFAYDDTGAAIEVGQTGVSAVPEPSSMLLLGLGGVGLTTCGLLRRRSAARTMA